MRGQMVVVHGGFNKLLVSILRLAPRRLARELARKVHGQIIGKHCSGNR